MASKQFKEFLVEFPAEYRHAHPVFTVLSRYMNKILQHNNNNKSSSLKLLEYGAGFGEHAVFFSHLIRQGALNQYKVIFNENQSSKKDQEEAFDAYLTSLHQKSEGYDCDNNNTQHVHWQPTEVDFTLPNLKSTIQKWKSNNLAPAPVVEDIKDPMELDVLNQGQWKSVLSASDDGTTGYDLIMTINTFHIVSEEHGYSALKGVSECLKKNGTSYFLAYGPYRVEGKQTSESNVKFDEFLKKQYGPHSGVRDMGVLKAYCEEKLGMTIAEVIPMPEENFILVFALLPSQETSQNQ